MPSLQQIPDIYSAGNSRPVCAQPGNFGYIHNRKSGDIWSFRLKELGTKLRPPNQKPVVGGTTREPKTRQILADSLKCSQSKGVGTGVRMV